MSTEQYQEALKLHHIGFSIKNNGLHLIVEGRDGYIDVWPTTGKWYDRQCDEHGFGLLALLARSAAPAQPAPVTLSLTPGTARWLKGVVQNPLWSSPEAEPEEDSRARREIWNALQGVQ